jgi:hypothetical protein
MKKIASIVLGVSSLLCMSASVQAVPVGATKIVTLGCNLPSSSPSSSTVYSIDNKDRAGGTILLPSQVKKDAVCSAALNAMQTGITGCSTGWVLVNGPTNLTIESSGYSLISYTYQCSII